MVELAECKVPIDDYLRRKNETVQGKDRKARALEYINHLRESVVNDKEAKKVPTVNQ